MFEIIRVDASRVHLHFHTNGTMDKPVLIPPTITPVYMPPTPSQPRIGRNECTLALTTILNACGYKTTGAADITDGLAFDWKRYVAHITDNREITAMQPEKVLVLRIKADELPRLAFCAGDTTWKTLQPQDAHYRNGSELTETHGQQNKQIELERHAIRLACRPTSFTGTEGYLSHKLVTPPLPRFTACYVTKGTCTNTKCKSLETTLTNHGIAQLPCLHTLTLLDRMHSDA